MKAISLFSGAGGFEQGFDRAGIETQLMVEIDEKAQAVLKRHYPETELIADVRDVCEKGTSSVLRRPGNVGGVGRGSDAERARQHGTGEGDDIDLIYGGFPCQDVSVAGHRKGLAGERSGLWFEFHRIVSQLQPRWVVIENVRGILSSNSGRDFEVILEGLDELGYGVSWAVLDAQHFGVPQRRARVFIVASLGNESSREVLALCESCGGHFEAVETPQQEVAGTLGGRTKGAGGFRQDLDTRLGDKQWLENQSVLNFDVMRRAGAGVRRLTVTECERLMGWPDGWTEYGIGEDGERINMADTHRFRLIGNGVASPVAQWLGHRLVEVDSWA